MLIVESLSPADLLQGLCEAKATADVLKTLGIPSYCERARSKADLQSLVRMFAHGKFDVLHIACHGCSDGIGVSDGEMVYWLEFVTMLGAGIQGKTLVMSACDGGCRDLAERFSTERFRPAVIVGPSGTVDWDRLLVGLQVYYRAVFPPSPTEKPDSPCVAVSRAELACSPGLVVHLWNEKAKLYDRFEPSPLCSLSVMDQVHGKYSVENARLISRQCCGSRRDPDETLELLARIGVSGDLKDLHRLREVLDLIEAREEGIQTVGINGTSIDTAICEAAGRLGPEGKHLFDDYGGF